MKWNKPNRKSTGVLASFETFVFIKLPIISTIAHRVFLAGYFHAFEKTQRLNTGWAKIIMPNK